MSASDESSRGGRASGPVDHVYPYPWVQLRSASAHMFLYQRMVRTVDPAARAGDVVAAYDRNGRLFGHAFYHDRSQIALRMLSYEQRAVDEAFFRDRLAGAVAWRERLIGDDTDACRLVHAEGDGLSGLIAERYADWIAIEVFSLGIYRRLGLFKRLLAELTGINRFVARADERIQRIEGFRIKPPDAWSTDSRDSDLEEGIRLSKDLSPHAGQAQTESSPSPDAAPAEPGQVIIRENGVRFRVDLRTGHKTGFFCDQRDNRRRLAAYCRGQDVLDVCCYTGGFGIYAKVLGGAQTVIGVDLDETAIELARRNANLNQVRVQHVHADAYAYLRQMQANKRTFSTVVLDPPKFVTGREDLDEGSRKYVDLNALAMAVTAPGGLLLTCSCSGSVSPAQFLAMVKAAATRTRRTLQFVDNTGAAPDHPIMSNCPESEYLKAIWTRVS